MEVKSKILRSMLFVCIFHSELLDRTACITSTEMVSCVLSIRSISKQKLSGGGDGGTEGERVMLPETWLVLHTMSTKTRYKTYNSGKKMNLW